MNINFSQIDFVALAKRYWKLGAIVLAVVLVAVLLFSGGNSYKTPIELQEDMMNAKTAEKMLDRYVEMLNGLGQDEMEDILKIMKKTEEYDTAEDMLVLTLDTLRENAGEKYKVRLTPKDKEKADGENLEYMQERIDALAEEFADRAEYMEENMTDVQDELDLSSKDIKKLVKAYKKLAKIFDKAKVTKVYDVEVKTKITGSALDEAMKGEQTYRVYKIGGRWISEEALLTLSMF